METNSVINVPKKSRPRQLRFAVVNFAVLLVLWLLEWLVGEKNWLVTLPTYAPPVVFAPVTLVLLTISLRRRACFPALINFLAAVFVAVFPMGLRLHFPDSSPSDLPVMTFNVEKWSHGTENVAAAIREQKPDVVCLQEAGKYFWLMGKNQSPDALRAAMPEYDWTTSGEIMVGARLTVLETRIYPLPPGPESRPAVDVVVKAGEKRVSVVAVHLMPSQFNLMVREPNGSLRRSVETANASRLAQAARLLESLRGVKNPIVISGDFNAQLQTQVCRTLTDVYADAFEATGNGFGYTLTATVPATRVDHLLTGGGIQARRVFVPRIVASDHRPLVADLALP